RRCDSDEHSGSASLYAVALCLMRLMRISPGHSTIDPARENSQALAGALGNGREADRSLLRRNEAVRRDEAVARRHDPAGLRAQPRHGVDVRHLVSSASCLAASFVLTRDLIAQYSLAERDHHPSRSRTGGLTWRTRGEQRQGA